MSKETNSDSLPVLTGEELLNAAYNAPKFPSGMNKDKISGSVFTLYAGENEALNNFPFFWHEFSASTKQEAESVVRKFISAPDIEIKEYNSTSRYYQFSASPNASMPERNIRVHKKSFIDDVRYNWQPDNDASHVFNDLVSLRVNYSPVTVKNVKELFDYLWLVRFKYEDGSKMIKSTVKNNGSSIIYSSITTKIVFGDWNMDDRIYLIRSDYDVSKKSGSVRINNRVLKQIPGRTNNK